MISEILQTLDEINSLKNEQPEKSNEKEMLEDISPQDIAKTMRDRWWSYLIAQIGIVVLIITAAYFWFADVFFIRRQIDLFPVLVFAIALLVLLTFISRQRRIDRQTVFLLRKQLFGTKEKAASEEALVNFHEFISDIPSANFSHSTPRSLSKLTPKYFSKLQYVIQNAVKWRDEKIASLETECKNLRVSKDVKEQMDKDYEALNDENASLEFERDRLKESLNEEKCARQKTLKDSEKYRKQVAEEIKRREKEVKETSSGFLEKLNADGIVSHLSERIEQKSGAGHPSTEAISLLYSTLHTRFPDMERVKELSLIPNELIRARQKQAVIDHYSDLIMKAEKSKKLSEQEREDIINSYRLAREQELSGE